MGWADPSRFTRLSPVGTGVPVSGGDPRKAAAQAEDMAQWIKGAPCKHEDLGLIPRTHLFKNRSGMEACWTENLA